MEPKRRSVAKDEIREGILLVWKPWRSGPWNEEVKGAEMALKALWQKLELGDMPRELAEGWDGP